MSTDEKGGSMQELPKMVPDREDIASRRKAPPEERKPSKPPTPEKPLMLWLLLLVFAVVLGFVVWQNFQLTLRLDETTQNLQLSDARISVMEGQLSATDENLVMNESNIKIQLTNHMSEIRKLWDVTNKRNKVWIEDNQAAIAALQTDVEAKNKTLINTLAGVEKDAKGLAATVKTIEDGVQALEQQTEQLAKQSAADQLAMAKVKVRLSDIDTALKQLDVFAKQLASFEKRWSTLDPRFDELTLSQTLLVDQVRSMNFTQRMSDMNGVLSKQQKAFEAAEQKNELAFGELGKDIASFNAYRLQVNERLTGLQSQLIALEKMVSDGEPLRPASP